MNPTRRITVRYFASLVDQVGDSREELQLARGLDVADLWRILIERHPALEGLSYRPLVACDLEYAPWDRILDDTDEVAFLPPVSGG